MLAAMARIGISLEFRIGRGSEEDIMKRQLRLAGLAILFGVAANAAAAQEKIKIGVIVTLSGPAAALGQQVRDGFALAVKDLGGKMGGPRRRGHGGR